MTQKIQPGMLVQTSYGTGPYRIVKVTRGCTCPFPQDEVELRSPPPRPPHVHLTCTKPDGSGRFWLNAYDEETLCRVHGVFDQHREDSIQIVGWTNAATQMELF
jgi:hypothetical protein